MQFVRICIDVLAVLIEPEERKQQKPRKLHLNTTRSEGVTMAAKKLGDDDVPRPNPTSRTIIQKGNTITRRGNQLIQIGNTSNVATERVYQEDNVITEENNYTYQCERQHDQTSGASADLSSVEDQSDQAHPIRGKLRPNHEYILKREYPYLLEQIDAKFLTAYLFSKCIIDLEVQDKIRKIKDRKERSQILLERLLDSGPRRAFPEFINSLEKEYEHVAQKLKDQM